MKSRSERTLRTRILLASVAAIEGIELADGDLDEAISAMAADVQQDADALKESLVTSGRVEVLTGDILRRKALDRIVASAVAVDDEGQDIDLRPPEVVDDKEESGDDADASVDESPEEEN